MATLLFRNIGSHHLNLPAVWRFVLGLGLLAILPACEKDISATVKINTKPQLVISAFISPQDTVLQVKVSKSQPVIGVYPTAEEARITEATVKLSQGGKTVTFTYNADQNRQVYEADPKLLPILPGQTYVLTVSTPNGYLVTASSTVPATDGIMLSDLKQTSSKVTLPGGPVYDEHVISFRWQDPPGKDNFYQTLVEKQAFDPQRNKWRWVQIHTQDDLFTDVSKDGQLLAAVVKYPALNTQSEVKPFNLQVYLAVTDRAYYRYHQSIKKQNETNGNPFAEPVLIFSNVKGGIGIFAAYNQIKAVLKVE